MHLALIYQRINSIKNYLKPLKPLIICTLIVRRILMPVKPKLAATVILLRERVPEIKSKDTCKFEVFMAQRHASNKFLGGFHVFPGGAIEEQDITKESRSRISGLDKDLLNKLKEICDNPSSLWIIAIRELFEETGILIAKNRSDDSLISVNNGENIAKFNKYQEDLQDNRIHMTKILLKENLYYAAPKLKYFGRLITPALSPIRFDTQFFLCELPPTQRINLFNDELIDGLWASPRELIKLNRKNQIQMIMPQHIALRRLTKFETIQEAFTNAKNAFRNTSLSFL